MFGATLQAGWTGSLEALSSGKERWGCKKVVWLTNGFIIATQHGLHTMGWQLRYMYLNNVYPRLTSSLAGHRDHHMETQGCRLARTELKISMKRDPFAVLRGSGISCCVSCSNERPAGGLAQQCPRNMAKCCIYCLMPLYRRFSSSWSRKRSNT